MIKSAQVTLDNGRVYFFEELDILQFDVVTYVDGPSIVNFSGTINKTSTAYQENKKAETKTSKKPTKRGREKYPNDRPEWAGYYTANGIDMAEPCTCKETCTYACKGLCGCEACHQSFVDFGY